MERLACIDVPAFPLQLLLKEHPEWRAYPAAVVAEDKPQAPLLWVNEKARQSGVLPGQRYSAALSLARELRAGTMGAYAIRVGVDSLTEVLRRYSPHVEPSTDVPGLFWLDASGLHRLYGTLTQWARTLEKDLMAKDFIATVVAGFTRFGTYAVAKSTNRLIVFSDSEKERQAALRVKLSRLAVDPTVRDALDRLGVRTVEDLLKLPAEGILTRYGSEAHRLYAFAAGELFTPLQGAPPPDIRERHAQLPAPDADTERLLFLLKRLLDSLLAELSSHGEALREVILRLALDHAGERTERIRPAAPTLDAVQILGLLRLRLESLRLSAGITEVTLTAETSKATREQLLLFVEKPKRDRDAAARAFARLRALFGDDAVVRAEPVGAHLPGARFKWTPLEKLGASRPKPRAGARPLVRRIFSKPLPLPSRPRSEPDGWLLRGLEHGPVREFLGPYVISGGWWQPSATEVDREYYFVKMQRGEVLWVFHDKRRRRWFLEGRVE